MNKNIKAGDTVLIKASTGTIYKTKVNGVSEGMVHTDLGCHQINENVVKINLLTAEYIMQEVKL